MQNFKRAIHNRSQNFYGDLEQSFFNNSRYHYTRVCALKKDVASGLVLMLQSREGCFH